MSNDADFVLVTTEFRGVFAGFLKSQEGRTVTLTKARCAIYWSTTGGFLELAQKGPNPNSRIGSEAEEITLYGVTSVARCTEVAKLSWLAKR